MQAEMMTWDQLIQKQKQHRITYSNFLVTVGYALDQDPNSWTFGTNLDAESLQVLRRLANGSLEYRDTRFYGSLVPDIEHEGSDYESFVQSVATKLLA